MLFAGTLNDMWSFSLNTLLWTFIGGNKQVSQRGTLGTKGVPSALSWPGTRSSACTVLIANQSQLFTFGGDGLYPITYTATGEYVVTSYMAHINIRL
jgi:hypothetical protein